MGHTTETFTPTYRRSKLHHRLRTSINDIKTYFGRSAVFTPYGYLFKTNTVFTSRVAYCSRDFFFSSNRLPKTVNSRRVVKPQSHVVKFLSYLTQASIFKTLFFDCMHMPNESQELTIVFVKEHPRSSSSSVSSRYHLHNSISLTYSEIEKTT